MGWDPPSSLSASDLVPEASTPPPSVSPLKSTAVLPLQRSCTDFLHQVRAEHARHRAKPLHTWDPRALHLPRSPAPVRARLADKKLGNKRAPKALPSAFALANAPTGARSKRESREILGGAPAAAPATAPPPPAAGKVAASGASTSTQSGSTGSSSSSSSLAASATLAATNAAAALAAPPPLADILSIALPKGGVGSLQQQADACMMLLRVDWKGADAVDAVQGRCHHVLHFMDVLTARAKALGTLKGTLFQALLARHNAEVQRKRMLEEARLAALEAAEAPPTGGDGGDSGAAGPTETASRATLDRGDDDGGAAASSEPAPLPAVLQPLSIAEVEALGSAGAELRGLLRIKVEDDQDLKTAQQALAECAAFLLLLRDEAPKRGLSHAELLKKCDLGEG